MASKIPVAEIVAVGNELLRGDVVDTNSAHIAAELGRLGIETRFHSAVGDIQSQLLKVLGSAAERADIVIVTGGLGPTKDDITREAVAACAKSRLVLDEDSLKRIEDFFRQRGYTPSENNLAQAMMPEGASVIPNPRGTAPGFMLEIGSALMLVLPGVPAEMKLMLEQTVLPHLHKLGLGGRVRLCRRLHIFGPGESSIDSKIRGWLDPEGNPSIGITVAGGIITVSISAIAPNEAAASTLIRKPESEIRKALGELVFGTDDETLQQATARLLLEQGLTLATAESCTGGLLTSMLVETAGVSASLVGGIVAYSNELKIRELGVPGGLIDEKGAVSPEVAEAMAKGARERLGADLGVAITGIAGPEGGTSTKPVGLVYIALADADTSDVRAHRFRGSRNEIRTRAAYTALNMLRLHLLDRPVG